MAVSDAAATNGEAALDCEVRERERESFKTQHFIQYYFKIHFLKQKFLRQLQGQTSRRSIGSVDMKTKIAFQHMHLSKTQLLI